MMMSEAPRALVAAHGDLAAGLISAVARVAGTAAAARLEAFTNAALGGAELVDAMREALARTGARVVFSDLPAGSCTITARRLAREFPGLAVVCGVNLPMLLSFSLSTSPVPDALRTAVDRGQAGICTVEDGTHGR